MTVIPHPSYVSPFPRLKINLTAQHFDTTEAIEAQWWVVLNTLKEHDFQDAFKKMAEELGMVHTSERRLLRG
jgi:hypothetical protein